MTEYRLGVDLGGTKIEAILMAADGNIPFRQRISTSANEYTKVVERIVALCEAIEAEAGIKRPLPLGIGTPGTLSRQTGLMKNCNSTCLIGHNLPGDLAKASGREVRIANDADCFVLSEAIDGGGKGHHSVFGVILGTGVGGGIVIGQRLLQGVNGICGEWGHNPLPLGVLTGDPGDRASRSCYCGRPDCVESWLSGPALGVSYAALTSENLTAAEIVARATRGDEAAQQVMADYHQLLALALSNVINIVDPDIIVLGGGLSNIASLYTEVPPLLAPYVFSDTIETRIVPAVHGDAGGARGAAWLWH